MSWGLGTENKKTKFYIPITLQNAGNLELARCSVACKQTWYYFGAYAARMLHPSLQGCIHGVSKIMPCLLTLSYAVLKLPAFRSKSGMDNAIY